MEINLPTPCQELLLRGVRIAERSRITSVLIGQGLSMADITSGQINYEKIGGLPVLTRSFSICQPNRRLCSGALR